MVENFLCGWLVGGVNIDGLVRFRVSFGMRGGGDGRWVLGDLKTCRVDGVIDRFR